MNHCPDKRNQRNTSLVAPARRPIHFNTRLLYLGFLAITLVLLVTPPVLAAPKYMAGSPELAAYISGSNEVSPGDTVPLRVVIQNKGVNQFQFVQPSVIDPGDLSNTATSLTVSMDSGQAPVVIKSGPQSLGNLAGSRTTTCTIIMDVDPEAPAGSYSLPLNLNYTYLYQADQYGTDSVQYLYKEKNETFYLPIKIKAELKISVLSVEGEHLNAGTEGYINLTVKNTGYENGKNAIVTIVRNAQSPVVPTTDSMYIGDFPAGRIITGRFKAAISGNASNQTYPLDILVTYENAEGDQVTSDRETIGVQVGSKIDFSITSAPAEIAPGQNKVIHVRYTNTGGATAYNAQALMSMGDPFIGSDQSAFLGTIAPGETRDAAFTISADPAATLKEYGLDSQIEFRDALNNDLISDPLKIRIQVTEDKGIIASILKNPLAPVLIAVVLIGAGFFVYRKRQQA